MNPALQHATTQKSQRLVQCCSDKLANLSAELQSIPASNLCYEQLCTMYMFHQPGHHIYTRPTSTTNISNEVSSLAQCAQKAHTLVSLPFQGDPELASCPFSFGCSGNINTLENNSVGLLPAETSFC